MRKVKRKEKCAKTTRGWEVGGSITRGISGSHPPAMLDEKSYAPSLGHARHAFLNSLCGAGKHDSKAVMGREVALSLGAERT